jgi:hypothetical protein
MPARCDRQRQPASRHVERNAAQSTPYWPPRIAPPKDASNILRMKNDWKRVFQFEH